MKSRILIAIVFGLFGLACDNGDTLTSTGYIKAEINGVKTLYATSVDNNIIYYALPNEMSIAFHSKGNEYLTWTISIQGLDFKSINYPYVIQSTNPPTEGVYPAFWCNVLDSDPSHSAYGLPLAGTANWYWNCKLTLTSFDGKEVRGKFEGEGIDTDHAPLTFKNGEFVAQFK